MWLRWLALGTAGFLGTLLRYWLSGWIARHYGESFPSGTLTVNLLGCFLIGALFHLFHEHLLLDPTLRTAIMVGFLGALTTFSSFGLQTFTLVRDGEFAYAAAYVLISNIAGFFLVWSGYWTARTVAIKIW